MGSGVQVMADPSAAWITVFPCQRIPDVLAYVNATWEWLRHSHSIAVAYNEHEPKLTDNICEALNDDDRKQAHSMDCDFQAETWELRRGAGGKVVRVARADIRVILGAPGTPHLIIEFKKLDGSVDSRRRYCTDGIGRFVANKYGVRHAYGVMCGLACVDLKGEAQKMGEYISQVAVANALKCIADTNGKFIVVPSIVDAVRAKFDTKHKRNGHSPRITLVHVLMPCLWAHGASLG
jgi:hypothetical protein